MSSQEQIDYDIHGLVGIRLINPSASDAAAVAGQLGPLRGPLSRQPDIVVRFVRQMPTRRLSFLGPNKHGFTDEGYFILRNCKQEARVRVAFDQIGKQCEMVCESGLQSVPLLMTILHLTALKKDVVPLHAAAFVYKGTGVLLTGWAKGGKTGALLAFALQGAEYVGDEWVLLRGDGQIMYGVPENINLGDWHLEHLPHVRRQVKRRKLLLFKGIHWLDRMQQWFRKGRLSRTFAVSLLREVMPALRSRLNVSVSPQVIFPEGFRRLAAKPEKVFLLLSRQDPSIDIQPSHPLLIARRMISAIRYEQLPFMEHYLAFRFAFPDMRSEFVERADELQYDILCRALAGKDAYTVGHPYPFSLRELFERMRPFCESPGNGAAAQV